MAADVTGSFLLTQHAIGVAPVGASQEGSARAFEGMIPLARHATPAEIAAAVAYLASDGSANTMAVDGGLSI